jgi:LPS O-antigen subunit length determinant protein (WzzB/FepE family)
VAFDSKPKWLIWITVAISAIVAIATTVIKTFKYQENWINYRTTCETLRKEKHFYTAKINEYDSAEDKEALFVDRVEALISRENTMWLTAQKQTKK